MRGSVSAGRLVGDACGLFLYLIERGDVFRLGGVRDIFTDGGREHGLEWLLVLAGHIEEGVEIGQRQGHWHIGKEAFNDPRGDDGGGIVFPAHDRGVADVAQGFGHFPEFPASGQANVF